MIFRRLAQHLKEQNWTAIGIEFVLLILGVFLGIQVANWNAERVAEQQSKLFTERLHADLRVEAWSYEFLIQYFEEVRSNAEKALAALEGSAELSNEQLLIAAYRATQYTGPTRRRFTFDELTATGNIELIRDPVLLDAASKVYTSGVLDIFEMRDMISRYREEFRMRIPVSVQSALAEHCGDRWVHVGNFQEIPGSLDYPCSTGLDQATIDRSVASLRNNEAMVPLLRLRVADVKTIVANLAVSNQDARASLDAVLEHSP